MIITINGSEKENFTKHIDQMHVLRKQIFHDRLKWDVKIRGDWEVDHFDECNPLYILSISDEGDVRGSLRLLPTTGPDMLRDVFSCLLDEDQVIEAPTIWESSRFCVALRDNSGRSSLSNLNLVTAELIAGMGEVGLLAGLSHVVTVYDRFLRRIIARAGCAETLVGGPVDIGGIKTYAGMFTIEERALAEFKANWGLKADLLGEQAPRLEPVAA